MKRFLLVLLVVVVSAPAFAADIGEISLGMFGGSSLGFGTLTQTDWRLHERNGIDGRLSILLTDSLSAALVIGRQRIESRVDGVTEASHEVPMALMFDGYGSSHGHAIPYLGIGVSYLRYRQAHATPDGQLAQPDHGALMTEAGVKYILSPRWRVNTGVQFGPARSTAEVMHGNGTVDKIDFHQLYVSAGIGFAF
jgi:outer membrane protein W